MSAEERHLTQESFVEYLRVGVPLEHPIGGLPRVVLFIDSARSRIGLRAPARPGESPGATGLEHVQIYPVHQDGHRMVEVEVDEPRLFEDAYPILCGVADRIQLDDMSTSRALSETLRRLGHLIRPEQTLTREVEIGLIGELIVLSGLVKATTPEQALMAWRGGIEEHDFGLARLDVEVKTTASENRVHRISSITQLLATGDRQLWLVSLQLTTAGVGGTTVAELIERANAKFDTAPLRDDFAVRLQAAGWRHRYRDTRLQQWRLRTEPLTFHVAGDFPRLTAEQLELGGADLSSISDIRYRIDVSGRSGDLCPEPLSSAVSMGRQELP